MALLYVCFKSETGHFLFEGAMCVKKNPRVRDSALIAGESTALGVDNSYISLGLSMIAFRL